MLLVDGMENWKELGALGALIVVVIWGITKGIPSIVARFDKQLSAQLEAFRVELRHARESSRDEIQHARQIFREELQEERAQSRALVESGHQAVNNLAASFRDLSDELRRDLAQRDRESA